jgi:hypothetical protein
MRENNGELFLCRESPVYRQACTSDEARFRVCKISDQSCYFIGSGIAWQGRQTPQTALRENAQPYRFWGLKIFTPLDLRFQDFQVRLEVYSSIYVKGNNSFCAKLGWIGR